VLIWQRYLLGRLAKTFLFFLCLIFFLYVVVDLSVHSVRFFARASATLSETGLYYIRSFAMHLDLFLPLTFLLASLKTLLDHSQHHEFVSLQMAGLSKRKLCLPYLLFAAVLSFAILAYNEWFAGAAQDEAYAFRKAHAKKMKKERVHSVALKDDSELVYQRFDDEQHMLFDVFWIRTTDDIWHAKYLDINGIKPEGHLVDHLVRSFEGPWVRIERFPFYSFSDMQWDKDTSIEKFIPFENRALTTLFTQALNISSERSSVVTHLHYKLSVLLFPFLVFIGIAPHVMNYTRFRPTLLIVAISLLALLGLKTILDGMLILGENQVIPSYIAIWTPLAIALGLMLPSFRRL
jgi:lipopolysaccharide export LptBFGC system permease protein LptF